MALNEHKKRNKRKETFSSLAASPRSVPAAVTQCGRAGSKANRTETISLAAQMSACVQLRISHPQSLAIGNAFPLGVLFNYYFLQMGIFAIIPTLSSLARGAKAATVMCGEQFPALRVLRGQIFPRSISLVLLGQGLLSSPPGLSPISIPDRPSGPEEGDRHRYAGSS